MVRISELPAEMGESLVINPEDWEPFVCFSGYVVWHYPNGDCYEGEVKNGMKHGEGTYRWADGTEYYDLWCNDRCMNSDRWVQIAKSSGGSVEKTDVIVMMGEDRSLIYMELYKKGDGHADIRYPNGDRYIGEVSEGTRHGRGTYIWDDGNHYVGQWENDKREGEGEITFIGGETIRGIWHDDIYNSI